MVDALTFGTWYSNCDSCATMYEVRPTTLCKDDSVISGDLAGWGYNFKTTVSYDAGRQATAKALLQEVPHELFGHSTLVLGDPVSNGGMYIRIQTIPGIYLIKIGLPNSSGQSAEVLAFKQKVLDVMAKVK